MEVLYLSTIATSGRRWRVCWKAGWSSRSRSEHAEPQVSDIVRFGGSEARITAMGPRSWAKARDLGQITFSFGGAPSADRPGEICVTAIPHDELWTALVPGTQLVILRA
jgi:PTS system glucitol/sorbitol-specific IIA component